ncbi:MAG: hypothetical protein ACHQXA_03015 [Gemmatimonadales bacterium]
MPRLSRWFIRTAFLYLVVALALGVALAAAGDRLPALVGACPVYIHFFMVGWLTQMIAGVAYWMFPRGSSRVSRATRPDDPRGWWVYGGLNVGLLLRAAGEPWPLSHWAGPLLIASALLQLAAAGVLVLTLWPRARSR